MPVDVLTWLLSSSASGRSEGKSRTAGLEKIQQHGGENSDEHRGGMYHQMASQPDLSAFRHDITPAALLLCRTGMSTCERRHPRPALQSLISIAAAFKDRNASPLLRN